MSKTPAGPLTGVTVLDLCSYLAGPYGCTLLAGQEIAPAGDDLRKRLPPLGQVMPDRVRADQQG